MSCRICNHNTNTIIDLGLAPLANRLKSASNEAENRYPLNLELCDKCGNIQIGHCVDQNLLYDDYLYITPESALLKSHYDRLIRFMQRRDYLASDSFVFEFGSNVGRFLQRVRPHVGRILGLDPARVIAERAVADGVPTICAYFGADTAPAIAASHGLADAVIARHCAAHNPDAHALVAGVREMLAPNGVFAMENAYGLNTVTLGEIGQIYHEHMFYFTARPVRELFAAHGLELIDLMMANDIHGGSMVFFGAPKGARIVQPVVETTIAHERATLNAATLERFAALPSTWRRETRALLDDLARRGRSVWLYGASAKAATFIAAVGLTERDAPFCADSGDMKIGRFLPGTGIEICSESDAIAARPDYFLVTAWNYRDEIIAKVRAAGNAHSGFATPFPMVRIVEPCTLDRIARETVETQP